MGDYCLKLDLFCVDTSSISGVQSIFIIGCEKSLINLVMFSASKVSPLQCRASQNK